MPNEEKTTINNKIYYLKKYFSLALDPIHIGTGGYRIGRVDNTIVREPSTGIPKIPGTTIEGCCRSYAYLKGVEEGILNPKDNLPCSKGKAKSDTEQPCGKCVICITFGFSQKEKSMQAMALFSDARILFFPVATMIGPVWVTCPVVLREAGIKNFKEPNGEKFVTTLNAPENKLNFGWLLLDKDTSKSIDPQQWSLPIDNTILKRIAIVPDNLFATIVNSNLEVRTSVAIDPERGTAEERALFTYEAVPRGTVFWFDVVYQNPKNFPSLNGTKVKLWDSSEKEPDFKIIENTVEKGLGLFEYLGVGGMGSRGFGRLEVLNLGG
jgi:CRISPR-associated protein Cmr4